MESGFIEQQAAKLVKSRKTAGISVLVAGLAMIALAVFMYFTSDPEYAGLIAGMFGFLGVVFGLMAISPFLKASKVKKQAADYGNLTVLSDNSDKKAAAKIINGEIAQGKIQLEVLPFKRFKDVKLILIPSYLLICQQEITAVPIDKVYWICACPSDINVYVNKQVVSLKGYVTGIFYGGKKYYIDAKNKEAAKEMASRFHKYIPDVLGSYDVEIDKMFDKKHAEFLEVFNRRKAEKYPMV